MNNFKDFNIVPKSKGFDGEKIKIANLFNTPIDVLGFEIKPSTKKENSKFLTIQILKDGVKRIVFTGSTTLMEQIEQVPKDKIPFKTTIKMGENDRYQFT